MEFASVVSPVPSEWLSSPLCGLPGPRYGYSSCFLSAEPKCSEFHKPAALLELDFSLGILYALPGTFSLESVFLNEVLQSLSVPLRLPQ